MTPTPNAPIADLTYRNYDGPLDPPVYRWWAIARMGMRLSTKKRGFWWWSALSAYWYVILLIVFFITDLLASQNPRLLRNGRNPVYESLDWPGQFLHAYSFAQILFFVLALLLGTGAIANDNRARALLVYLSKPLSRLDYVIGKWLGVFVPLTLVAFVPMALFWMYGALSFREYGFLSKNPFLLPKLALVAMTTGALHASLSLAVSSMFDQGRLAGAAYAGLYFISNFFTKVMQFVNQSFAMDGRNPITIVTRLFYASVDGVQIGMAKLILGTPGTALFPVGAGGGGGDFGENHPGQAAPGSLIVPSPPLEIMLPVFLLLVAGGFLLAWRRVRAVEVVG